MKIRLHLWKSVLGKMDAGKPSPKYIPVVPSDYPIKNEKYMAFEVAATSRIWQWVEPNYLTYLRILISFFMLGFSSELPYTYVFLFTTIGALSDFFDGALARSRGKKTRLGVILDPFADKLLVFAVLYILIVRGEIKLIYFVLMLLCESHIVIVPILSYFYQWCKNGDYKPSLQASKRVEPSFIGRAKLHLYVYSFLLIMMGRVFNMASVIAFAKYLLISGMAAASMAMIQYVVRWIRNPH